MPKRDNGRGVALFFVFLYHREYENLLKNVLQEKGRDGMMYVPGHPRLHIEKWIRDGSAVPY